ncbi:HNH endonuclease [Aneurinibacillus thermoaerophilus]|jgi:5-methylcytosine-specific restriction endonuclease McrA|uniref:HNH endonuclease n=1 Tax=Aneurinibacillus thermoaerophilus TaxID=143495 RepID=UPI002E1B6456|nr:HNH endonuclease [Aneurinibacillus thermoaerophilus]MED0680247.1 HNH endonuclease [Aneurinibacillus thermoaerophilus]MED0738701.1 HNH endonuclease [Aneurinibacillus thermoaerophilus]MED0765509.1 HNH endonuclease [Aneurinibacillus thermoaerophilus]
MEQIKITYPLPKERMHDEDTFLNCRWCGIELNDKRKRFCTHEHRDLWLNEIFYPEDFNRQRHLAMKRDGEKCQHCGMDDLQHYRKFNQSLHAHHIVPRCQGGSNHMSNLIILCRDCHVEEHRKLGVGFGQ